MPNMQTIQAQKGLQEMALKNDTDFLLLGGAAGACKTYTMFMDSLRHIDNSHYRAVFFRGAASSIFDAGGLWDTAESLYPYFGATSNKTYKLWRFPSGAEIRFKNVDIRQFSRVKHELRGMQYNIGYFDEVTELTAEAFWYIVGRARDTGAGITSKIFMTCNPRICWVKDLILWYLDDQGYPDKNKAGTTRYFVKDGDNIIWEDQKQKLLESTGDANFIRSFTFLPGTLDDNKILMDRDPGYKARLNSLSKADRMAMLYGCWNAQESNIIFNYRWFRYYTELPEHFDYVICCVDTASKTDKQHDYSAASIWGYKAAETVHSIGKLYLIDLLHDKLSYQQLKLKFVSMVEQYQDYFRSIHSGIYIEDANVGTALYEDLRYALNFANFKAVARTTKKVFRAKNVQGFVEQGGIFLPKLKQTITNAFIEEVCQFSADDSHKHDDITDTMCDAIEKCELQQVYKRAQSRNRLTGRIRR